MAQILQQNNLTNIIPGVAKKKQEEKAPETRNNAHALIAIHSSSDAWIIDSRASHHITTTIDALSSLKPYSSSPIFLGDGSLVEATGIGKVEMGIGSFENVLHIPKLFVNFLYVYQMTHTSTSRRVEFTLDSVSIFDIEHNSRIVIGKENRQSHM